MKKLTTFLALMLFPVSAMLLAVEVKNGVFEAEINPCGAVLTKLSVQGKQWCTCIEKQSCFDDQLGQNQGEDTQLIEYTKQLDYALREMTFDNLGTKVAFSLRSLAYPGLRLEKTYTFSKTKPEITLQWELRNTGTKPLDVSLNTRAFLLRENTVNNYLHPTKDSFKEFASDEKSFFTQAPERPFLAVRDDKNDGAVIILPETETAGVLNWILRGPFGGYTQEFFSMQHQLSPGESHTFEIKVVFTSDVAGCVASVPIRKTPLQGVLPVQVERLNKNKPKAVIHPFKGGIRPLEKFIDVCFNRQFNDSWRSVIMPADIRDQPLAVYQIENGCHSVDRPVEFFRQGDYLMLKVSGLLPDGGMSQNKGRAWNVIENGYLVQKMEPFRTYGKVAFPCRIAIGDKNGREVKAETLPDGGSLFLNSGFERADSKKTNLPEGALLVGRKELGSAWLESAPGTEGRALKLGSAFWDFIPEPGEEYTISFRAKSIQGGDMSRASVTFFSADGQILKELRKNLLASDRPFDWRRIEGKFRMPENAALIRLLIRNGGKEQQELLLDDLNICSAPRSTAKQSIRDTAKKELEETWRLPLSLLEPISMENGSPHETWFKPAAQQTGEVLFLTNVDTKITTGIGRRKLVELAQRNDLTFRHIPLIRKILSISHGDKGAYSVQGTTFDHRLSDYTLACLKELSPRPGIVCIMEFNFDDAGEEFIPILRAWQAQGTNLYLFHCLNTPQELLGQKARDAISPLIPMMRTTNPKGFSIQWHKNGDSLIAVRNKNFPNFAAFIPAPLLSAGGIPNLYGRDFPWYEFDHQIDMAVLRRLGGIIPSTFLQGASLNGVEMTSAAPFKGSLELAFHTCNRDKLAVKTVLVSLKGGTETIPLPVDGLPAGELLLYLRLLSEDNKVVDAGGAKVVLPGDAAPEVLFDAPDRIFRWPTPVSFKVRGIPADCNFTVEIENSHGEVVFRENCVPGGNTAFAVNLPDLHTLLNYVRVRTFRQGKPAAFGWGEFSVTGLPVDLQEYHGFINHGPVATEAIRGLGFDFIISGDPRRTRTSLYRNFRSNNLIPIPRRGDDKTWFRKYRGDVETEPVRTPCFSSPEFKKELHDDTVLMVEQNNMVYYDVSNLWAGDEMFLGQSVCCSPTCLAEFRRDLEAQYHTIDALNKEWESSFHSFDEVVPKQRNELVSLDNLASWVDHKFFMSKSFARNFFGTMRDELAALVPDAKLGLTGTQRPGYGYNWWEIIKYCHNMGYYAGVQTTMINDFGERQLLAGQCGGGYTHGHIDYEPYNYDTMWFTLLNGGNLAYHWYGCSICGDWKITDNLKYYSRSLKEIKSGIGKMWLEAQNTPDVAVFFSMPSLFTAICTIGEQVWQDTQTSWMKLLGDLKIESRFLAGEEIVENGIPPQYKVVILPMALALSDKEVDAFVQFVERGGTIIADVAPGRFDEHGKRRNSAALNKLFAPCTDRIAPKFIKLPGRDALFETAEAGLPTCQFKSCGKGGAFLANLLISRYSSIQMGGEGGEVASATEGEAQFQELWQGVIGENLLKAGVPPFAQVKRQNGSLYGCHARFRQDGPNRFYAFHQPASRYVPGRFDFSKGDDVIVQIPAKGHVYEVRSGKYLGFTDTFHMKMIPGWSMIYGVLSKPVADVTLAGSKEASCGEKTVFRFAATGPEGAQTFHLTLCGPDGKEIERCAKNIRTKANEGEHELFIPFNASKGSYHAEITHTVSKRKASVDFTVK
ncbi:MAG: beta-galactosidase [Victivallales bacterium]|nr:beta-galactosidase [Victivallales bacterium]